MMWFVVFMRGSVPWALAFRWARLGVAFALLYHIPFHSKLLKFRSLSGLIQMHIIETSPSKTIVRVVLNVSVPLNCKIASIMKAKSSKNSKTVS